MCTADEQQFCLRWNNFQANITSQFETLRDDEDFTDVTIACEGQRLQAHKIVLSACSPFFKELFKSNPCPHPIIFMRDVEAQHIVALMEFMYAGEVNVAQAQLSAFLKTAESLKIRGLTDTSSNLDCTKEENGLFLNPQPSSSKTLLHSNNKQVSTTKTQESSSSTVTSSQDFNFSLSPNRSPTSKRLCKNDRAYINSPIIRDLPKDDSINVNPFALQNDIRNYMSFEAFEPKVEMPDYLSDDETKEGKNRNCALTDMADLPAGMEIIPQNCSFSPKGNISGISQGTDNRKLHSLDPRPCSECGRVYSNLSNLRQHMKLIHFPTYVECHVCRKTFKTDLYLRRHMISAHEMTSANRNIVQNAFGTNEFQPDNNKSVLNNHNFVLSNNSNTNNNNNSNGTVRSEETNPNSFLNNFNNSCEYQYYNVGDDKNM
ncbi:protein bric-a-brac 1-like isoform X4 [Agrilus planipennis]|uniref:Protein bric-a-brac 1-like isoform X4 n=1 Tax=Agrilus planipennis TaxID=224129 RepID=A0A1W4XS23_AGRPL|nr:protein bric-a-brac 1-like isoform X4 [Agrilus planipennis]